MPFWRRPRAPERERTAEARWAAREIAPWIGRTPSVDALARAIDVAVADHPTLFRIDIDGAAVTVAPKPAMPLAFEGLRARTFLYRDLLEDVVRGCGLDVHAPLLFDCNDLPATPGQAPVFAFQKTRGTSVVLLPDVDLLASGFNVAADVQDPFRWSDKADTAIFVGATTGHWHDEESVRERRLPRLAAAEHFRASPRVTWELPEIVQCSTPQAAEMIRAFDVGGRRRSWREQFAHKVLLSMDGNGATCSRVSIALASRSVLAKFASPQVLHYFDGLEPGRHYAPLDGWADVDALLDALAADTDRLEAMAREGRAFAARHLTRVAAQAYVAELLVRYDRLVQGLDVEVEGVALARAAPLADLVATDVEGVRRLEPALGWAGRPRSGRPIGRLALQLAPGLDVGALSLHVRGAGAGAGTAIGDGEEAAPPEGGPIREVRLALGGAARRSLRVDCEAVFADGVGSGLQGAGRWLRSPSHAPLEALRLAVSRR